MCLNLVFHTWILSEGGECVKVNYRGLGVFPPWNILNTCTLNVYNNHQLNQVMDDRMKLREYTITTCTFIWL